MSLVSLASWLRAPAVAGRFYPAEPVALAKEIEGFLQVGASPAPARLLIGPHAGIMYSGEIAGATYAQVDVPESAIVLSPNHTGRGARRAVWPRGSWSIPTGEVPVDEALAALVLSRAGLEEDRAAHIAEHSLEVHLPFLRARRSNAAIVPICLARLPLEECREVGTGIAAAVSEDGRDVLLVASTDMSHYISAEEARRLDSLAIERILALDPEGLYATVERHGISMCGYIPTTVALFAARELGASRAKLVRYGSSGDVTGDPSRVVGYAGLVVA